jgi:hypothetical protein
MSKKAGQRVLVIGPPASGKMYLSRFFCSRGKNSFDADDAIADWVDGHGNKRELTREKWGNPVRFRWVWDKRKLMALLRRHKELYLFGNAYNAYDVMGLFDRIYYLRATRALLSKRFESRKKTGRGSARRSSRWIWSTGGLIIQAAKQWHTDW